MSARCTTLRGTPSSAATAAASAAPVAASPAKPSYERRRPEASALYQVVQDNLRTLYAAIDQGFAKPLPGFVRDELERFVDCGVLARGFAVLACPDCGERLVVAFNLARPRLPTDVA